jgi:hypothetical protein
MESVGTPHPYKSDHVTMGGSKSWVLEKISIIFLLYEAPGTEFQVTEYYSLQKPRKPWWNPLQTVFEVARVTTT